MSNEIHDEIIMGSLGNVYGGGDVQCITFCVTEECNLRCRYCYMVHKNSFRRMTFEVAKRAIDYLLEYPFESDCVQWDFIGGEPTLEMELIDKISDYIKIRMFETNHKWFDHYIFSVGTNGILYDSELVQRYISKNRYHVSFGITIDGTKLKHDLQRVFPNGQGSYELVEKNVALWKKQFPNASTKVTFASEDLCMLKESIVHLWNLGLNVIPANIVYEDVWKPGDAEIYEQQLIELADYIIENRLWADHSVRFFDPNIGLPLSKCQKEHNYCGTGKMIAIDCTGDFFPCIRFLDFCMPDEETPRLKSGDIHNGINRDIVAAFENLSLNVVNDGECADCPIASGCFTCTGNSYAYTYPHTIYSRTKFQCEMQKAQVRANNYFWKQLGQLLDYPTPREVAKKNTYENANWDLDGAKYLYFIISDHITPHCMYTPHGDAIMSQEVFEQALLFAFENHMLPVFIGNPEEYIQNYTDRFFHVRIDAGDSEDKMDMERYIPVYQVNDSSFKLVNNDVCILQVKENDVSQLFETLVHLAHNVKLINVYAQGIISWTQFGYQKYIDSIEDYYKWQIMQNNTCATLNLFTANSNSAACRAGCNDFSVAPHGALYPCPAYYFSGKYSIGDVYSGFRKFDQTIFTKLPQCVRCEATAICPKCHAINLLNTGLPNVPDSNVCAVFRKINAFLEVPLKNAHDKSCLVQI